MQTQMLKYLMGFADTFAGYKILEEVESPVNGKLRVVFDLAWGVHIMAGGLTQSGGIAEQIWRTVLKKVKSEKLKVKSCLILGLGGGGIAKLVRKNWPGAEITGVDIDPVIINLGKKYMGLDKYRVQVQVQDAYEYVAKNSQLRIKNFDLICIDTYVGDEFPSKLENNMFLCSLRSHLTEEGVAIFNRLYYDDKRPQAMRFLAKLEKVFPKVDVVYPEANVMFVCSNGSNR